MKLKLIIITSFVFLFLSCEDSFNDINYNPNDITTDEVIHPKLLVKGTMLADISINVSHLQRISGMWSGQYKGLIALYLGLYNYDFSSEESNSAWTYLYNGIIKQNREIAKYYANNTLDTEGKSITAITNIIEAHAVGTATSIWGDIPYSEAVSDVSDPKFDKQSDVYAALHTLIDQAIVYLTDPNTENVLEEDIFFGGDKDRWLEVAYTLKARYYLQTKQYSLAYQAAQNGISSHAGTMKFVPLETRVTGTENLLYRFMVGARSGYMDIDDTYCKDLLSSTASVSRRNAKTNEEARAKFLDAGHSSRTNRTNNIAGELTPMNLVSYQENLLILAETGARTISFDEGLTQLNLVRAFLASGDAFDKRSSTDALAYDAYETADFNSGGMENIDEIDPTRALLREIIEERYVSGFGTFIPWNDLRRLRKSDTDISVPVPFNTSSVTEHPQRFIISQAELNSNSNAPTGLTIFDKTEVNQ